MLFVGSFPDRDWCLCLFIRLHAMIAQSWLVTIFDDPRGNQIRPHVQFGHARSGFQDKINRRLLYGAQQMMKGAAMNRSAAPTCLRGNLRASFLGLRPRQEGSSSRGIPVNVIAAPIDQEVANTQPRETEARYEDRVSSSSPGTRGLKSVVRLLIFFYINFIKFHLPTENYQASWLPALRRL